VPDQRLLDGLQAARGKGRNDYPLVLLWRVVLLTILLRHVSFNACLAELHRNPALCRLLGIQGEQDIPNGWNLSRFLDVLGREPHLTALRQVFDSLARRLGTAVPDLYQLAVICYHAGNPLWRSSRNETITCGRPPPS